MESINVWFIKISTKVCQLIHHNIFQHCYCLGFLQAYLNALAGFAFLVLFVAGSLVQLAPKGVGFPAGHRVLQAAVEGAVLQRVKLQVTAHNIESLQGAFTVSRLNKVLK